tara:strand:- start:269 stop:952 length:684 start_codon:yes stop_codon:yes gene_type:complete
MTQKQLIELIQQHHATMGETEIRLALNRAQDDYCAKTELIKTTYVQDSIAGKRYYTLDSQILKITKVQINDVDIPRLIGTPIIDDDEFDAATGLTAPASSSNDRFWYIGNDRLAIVEKATSTITRDGKQSDYQSISEVKEIRIYAIAQATDFTTDLTEVSEIPNQFHDALVYKVIADSYLKAGTEVFNPQVSQIFEGKYLELVKNGKKKARDNYISSGSAVIRPTAF